MKYKSNILESIWAEDINLKIINIKMLLKAMRPDKIR